MKLLKRSRGQSLESRLATSSRRWTSRFGGASTGAPLVVYIGGAIGREDYVARSLTPPDPIAAEFRPR
jgi:hypothetical protein